MHFIKHFNTKFLGKSAQKMGEITSSLKNENYTDSASNSDAYFRHFCAVFAWPIKERQLFYGLYAADFFKVKI